MQRRKFIMALGGAVTGAPFAAPAQQATGRLYKIGYLGPATRELHLTKAFEDGLRSLGYRIGENVVIEYRFANEEMERLPTLAADLVRFGVDIIVAAYNPMTVAAMQATTRSDMAWSRPSTVPSWYRACAGASTVDSASSANTKSPPAVRVALIAPPCPRSTATPYSALKTIRVQRRSWERFLTNITPSWTSATSERPSSSVPWPATVASG